MLNLSSIMIGSAQPKMLASFYEKIFGNPADWTEVNWWGWQVGDTLFMIGEHSELKGTAREPQRIILNLETREVKEEFERIKNLGAKVVKSLYQMDDSWIGTFADPDGNYFQVLSPWETGSQTE